MTKKNEELSKEELKHLLCGFASGQVCPNCASPNFDGVKCQTCGWEKEPGQGCNDNSCNKTNFCQSNT